MNKLYKYTILLASAFSVVGCHTNKADFQPSVHESDVHYVNTQDSHSCPKKGHGPCYLCDKEDSKDDAEEMFSLMFSFLP